ncbi:hypothetical protein IWW50_000635 [Coemansia erecta]|nr:hypothetical protein IWW50_000635 [Coemansia erecta]
MKLVAAIAALAAVASAAFYPRTTGQDLCCAANAARAKAGLKPYKWAPSLDVAAQGHSEYMRGQGKIDHEEVPGTVTFDLGSRLKVNNFVFGTAGENIANGYDSLDATQVAWMNSEGHRANILSTSFTVCGGGAANPGMFLTVDFASPMDEADDATFYTLDCSGSTSAGGNTGTPVGHNAVPAASSAAPAKPAATKPVAAVPSASTAPKETAAVEDASASEAPAPQASPAPVAPPAKAPGKCKRMPKGSIAAGKCKPCKKCASSPLRR